VGRPEDTAAAPIPLVILTGFLGAGKTTVLNRVLAAQHHRRVAVLVNELGRIDIDAALIRGRAGDVLELTGGCACHQIGVQRELWSALADIAERSRPDVVVLETTGIAEPDAILRGLERLRDEARDPSTADDDGTWSPALVDERRRRALRGVITSASTAVVTVVDAEAGGRQLAGHDEARAQVVSADRILLSKLDLAPAPAVAELHQTLNALNPSAERAAFPPGAAATSALTAWLLDAGPSLARERRREQGAPTRAPDEPRPHAHAHQLAAATYVDDAPLIAAALLLAIDAFGDRLVRAKGFVHIDGDDRRGIVQRAGGRTTLEFDRPWGDEPRLTRLVLIGDNLDEAALHRRLWACRAGNTPGGR
jgi:G3E family GTPase